MARARRLLTLTVITALLTLGAAPFANAVEVDLPELVEAELAIDDVPDIGPLGGDVSTSVVDDVAVPVVEAPIAFTGVWAELPDDVDVVSLRFSVDGEDWTAWVDLEAEDDVELDGPDAETSEAADAAAVARVSELYTTDEARYVQARADGAGASDLVLRFVDAGGLNETTIARLVRHLTPRPLPVEAATVPSWVESRGAWGAAAYRGNPSVARNGVQQVVLHHTAGQNNLGDANGNGCVRSQVISTIRGIQSYHQNGQGWSDIGYNVVIDPCGGVWEGRAGGLDRAVVGAHAANWNTGSTGVSVLGNFTTRTPNARILTALDRVVGWKAGIHGISLGSAVTRNGRTVSALVGHQQVGSTACPGRIMNSIGRIRTNAASQAGQWTRVPDGLGAARFSDIRGGPHAAAIEQLVQLEITDGWPDGTFRPQEPINRAQVATFLSRALELDAVAGSRFRDIGAGFVHTPRINALVDAGIVSGYADGTFRPAEPLQRRHMAVILTRALQLQPRPDAARQFSDVDAYAGEIGALAASGITSGRGDGTFDPNGTVTRAQMATFIINALRVLREQR